MSSALLGSTGFIGRSLSRVHEFDRKYHSTTIDRIRGQHFDLLVCAGLPAEKWEANLHPRVDWQNMLSQVEHLKHVAADQVVVISTIDVYGNPGLGSDESSCPSPSSTYGAVRLRFEQEMTDRFDASVLRLPGMFGRGLKKNVIFDLRNRHRLEHIDERACYQWLSVNRVWGLILRLLELRESIRVVNAFTESVRTSEIIGRFCPEIAGQLVAQTGDPTVYRLRTKYGRSFGSTVGGYIHSREDVFKDLAGYWSDE